MSFGYGIGDFIAGANLAHQLIRVMTETRGACTEYQEAMTELCAIQQAFIHVSQISRSSVLPQATLNSASFIVMSSMDIIEKFLNRTKFYQKKLAGSEPSAAAGSWCKVGWALFKKEELKTLRDSLHCRLVAINTLFAAAHHTHTIPDSIARFQVSDDEYYEEASYPDSAVGLSEVGTPTRDSSSVPEEREFINPEISEVADSSPSQVSELGQGLTAITTKNNEGEKQIPDPKEYQTESATIQATAVRAHSSPAATERKLEESPRKRGWKANPSHQLNHSQPDVEAVVQKRLAAAKKDWEAEAEAAAQEWRKKVEELAQLNAEIGARSKLESERKALDEARLAEEIKIREEEAMKKRYLEEAMVIAEKKLKKTEKPPLKFKDAVGRKFSFPFHICQTWQGMEELIKQAFLHVDVIGPHVQEGHYDLIGPNGEIILPSIWEKVIEPDWAVTMHMWPLDKVPPPGTLSHPGQRPNMHGSPRPPHLPLGVQNQPRPGGAQHGGMPQFPAQRPHGGMPQFTGHQSHGVRFPVGIEARPESIYSTTKPRFASLRRWIPSRLKRLGRRSESDASSISTVSSSGSDR